jgi:Polyketide cyclase / dehydrase and lipid transport
VSTIRQSVEVDVPVRTAYDQWTQFEEFPRFMAAVDEVRQLDDTHLHWVAQVAGHRAEWSAEITEQIPDARIAWRSTSGRDTTGLVTFESVDSARTLVTVDFEYETEGLTEGIGSAIGVDDRQVKADLERFKELIEAQGEPSGAWRGKVPRSGEADGAMGDEPEHVPPVDEQPPGPGAEPQRRPAVGSIESGEGLHTGLRAGQGPERGLAGRDPAGGTGTGAEVATGSDALGLDDEDAAARRRGV